MREAVRDFEYDVFLSHANADRVAVRELAERLKRDGLRVWLDAWVIQPGDSIPLAIERGLESSRTLILVMSQAAFDSEWVTLERHTALFRDPTNQQRRFIPLRLDDCEIKDSLKQFAYIDWWENREAEYAKLLSTLTSKGLSAPESAEGQPNVQISEIDAHCDRTLDIVYRVLVTPDGKRLFSCSMDASAKVWDFPAGNLLHRLSEHTSWVLSIGLTPCGKRLVTSSADRTIKVWDVASARCLATFTGHTAEVSAISVTPDGTKVVSAADDSTLKVWDLESGQCLVDVPLDEGICNFAQISLTADGTRAVSATDRKGNVAVFDVSSGERVLSLQGHSQYVRATAVSPNDQYVVTGSDDTTIKVWSPQSGECLGTLEGHTRNVRGLAFVPFTNIVASGSGDGTIKLWDVRTGDCLSTFSYESEIYGLTITPDSRSILAGGDSKVFITPLPELSEMKVGSGRYTNAKVLLVGDSGVGKSGLAIRLVEDRFEVTESTDAHWATQLELPTDADDEEVEREIWVWDFAGQADYRLIHQLFMDETALALLVFNPQASNPFEGLGQWDRDLDLAARRDFAKLLVAGRCDRGGLTISRESIAEFARERGYQQFLQTSAKTGEGCDALRRAIEQSIDWDSLPWTASPKIFRLLKKEVIRLSDEGFTLLRMSELKQQLEMRLPDDPFTYEELQAVVRLLAGPGHVWQLEFGQFVLLHPERINSYAAAVGRTVRSHLQQIGVIHESAMLAGQLNFGDIQRLPPREEAIVLRAMHQCLVDHGFCLTQETDAGPLLVFPSYFNRERRDQIDHPRIFGTFRFSGALEELYATLVVKLHHTRAFETEELWRYAADFLAEGGKVGLKMNKLGEGDAEIITYCDPDVAIESKVSFVQYIHGHLKQYDAGVTLVRHYACLNDECGEALSDVRAILRARERGRTHLTCQYCDESIPLWDELEQELASKKYEARVQEMKATSRARIDRESRDLQLEYHAFAIAEEASQSFVPEGDEALGVQARIELTELSGLPSNRCLYLQLRPAEIYTSVSTTREGQPVFGIDSGQLVEQWARSDSPVLLAHRTEDGYVRWMNVSAWLKGKSEAGQSPVKEIVFDGEPFTALSLQRLRDRLVSGGETTHLSSEGGDRA